ncbi:hypothetical protein EJ05DRAFT_474713 [Pseudovirgaria hyperparasitica]|uniref:Uncharacterized protein n=1 Tax=Pseudovirgaria hyperparasitica TaxID=470096 RepID=A0A6A6WAD2_9PEZI|nr:uncharacterized protein EJ05DRAFT_474713 [Pseudovirgaria hyperparasitica]KAF2759633.1 hypothetical protein EJ05DRAFT_474713 [Pseudovirgaria hyperparasitica]
MVLKEVSTIIPPNQADGAPKRINMIARKDFRDRFEAEKPGHEKFFSSLFGGEWTIKLDPSNLFTYTEEKDASMFGYYCNKYFADGQVRDNLANFTKEYAADGITQINKLAHTHTITIEPSSSTSAGLDFADGKFRILFSEPDGFTSGASYWSGSLSSAVSAAEASGPQTSAGQPRQMSIVAKRDIRDRFEAEIGPIEERVRKYLQAPDFTLDPNFEANYAFYAAWEEELKADPDETAIRQVEKGWEGMIGYFTLKYFVRLADYLRDEGFAKDEMLREGFKEVVNANWVVVRQVEDEVFKDARGNTEDAVIEDGVLVFRTTRKAFGWNEGRCVMKIMDLL